MKTRVYRWAGFGLSALGVFLLGAALPAMPRWAVLAILGAICLALALRMHTFHPPRAADEQAAEPSPTASDAAPTSVMAIEPLASVAAVPAQPADREESACLLRSTPSPALPDAAPEIDINPYERAQARRAALAQVLAQALALAQEQSQEPSQEPNQEPTESAPRTQTPIPPLSPPPLILNVTTYQDGQVSNRRQVPVRLSLR